MNQILENEEKKKKKGQFSIFSSAIQKPIMD